MAKKTPSWSCELENIKYWASEASVLCYTNSFSRNSFFFILLLLVSKPGNEEIVIQYRQENAQANGADGILSLVSFIAIADIFVTYPGFAWVFQLSYCFYVILRDVSDFPLQNIEDKQLTWRYGTNTYNSN